MAFGRFWSGQLPNKFHEGAKVLIGGIYNEILFGAAKDVIKAHLDVELRKPKPMAMALAALVVVPTLFAAMELARTAKFEAERLKNDINRITSMLESLNKNVNALHVDMNALCVDVNALREDVNTLRVDVNALHLDASVKNIRRPMVDFSAAAIRYGFMFGKDLTGKQLVDKINKINELKATGQ